MSDSTNTESSTSSVFSAIKKELFYIAIAALIAVVGVMIYNRYTDNQYKELLSKLEVDKEAIVRELNVIDQNIKESKARLDDINESSNKNVVALIEELNDIRKGVTPIEIESDEDVKKYLDYLISQSGTGINTNK